jgi:hypothetical protein
MRAILPFVHALTHPLHLHPQPQKKICFFLCTSFFFQENLQVGRGREENDEIEVCNRLLIEHESQVGSMEGSFATALNTL